MKRSKLLASAVFLITLSGCAGATDSQSQRNNYDSCRIAFVGKVSPSEYKSSRADFDRQAEAACAPLLKMSNEEAAKFETPSPDSVGGSTTTQASKSKVTLQVIFRNGDWTVIDTFRLSKTDVEANCRGRQDGFFSYPLNEKIVVTNETGKIIGLGRISSYVSSSFRTGTNEDPDTSEESPYETNFTCVYGGSAEVFRSGNFLRVSVASSWVTDLMPFSAMDAKNWKLVVNN